jgi:hypothetical protein
MTASARPRLTGFAVGMHDVCGHRRHRGCMMCVATIATEDA